MNVVIRWSMRQIATCKGPNAMKVAIIGAGGAGLTTAWLLDGHHDVTLYEQTDRLGGHAHTITLDLAGTPVAVDAGFEFLSDAMFPTFVRLLRLLDVPLQPYPMRVTMCNTRDGSGYLMPPFHGWRIFPAGFAPRKVADLLRFARILRASGPLMHARDTTLTVQRFLDQLGVPEPFRLRFLYPFLQGGWGVSLDEIRAFAAYDILKYSALNISATLIPRGWKEIVGGTQTYVQAVARALESVRVKLATGVTAVERLDTGYRVLDTRGESAVYDHVVLATNANQAAETLTRVERAAEARSILSEMRYFATTIAVHGDTRLMPPRREHWSTVNIRYDAQYSQVSVWRQQQSGLEVFKSWVTHDHALPDRLYATVRFLHPCVDTTYFALQGKLQRLQGHDNLWLAGVYMVDVDCHESAVLSAVNVARCLAPQSPRLKRLTEPSQ
jgi:predicted NAD/FAD-binding protein